MWNIRALRRNEGPMRFVICALLDPLVEQRGLFGLELLPAFRRRHLIVRIDCIHTRPGIALREVAGDERAHALVFAIGTFRIVDATPGLARTFIGTVAGV